jgi:sulfofructose kinase
MDLMFRVDPLPAGGGKSYATAFREIGGGVAANAAVAIVRLGGRARYVGRVGDDPIGERIVSELQADGVDTNGVRAVPGVVSPVSAVLVDDAGERIIVNYTPPGLFDGGDHHQAGELAGVDAVLVDVRWPDGAALALTSASEAGIPGVFDFDRPMDAHGDVLLAAASHVAFSHPALTATARSDAWLAVTMGDAGVVWREAGSTYHLPAFPVEVVDTVGAGDVFHGALALALAEGQPEAEAVRFASAAAALKCTRPGGRAGSPSRRDVEGLLAHAT